MSKNYDLIVIGTGSAASTVAYKCRSAGWEVVVIDSRPFGGTCALRGCDPKKVLVGAAELLDWHNRMAGYGIISKDAKNLLVSTSGDHNGDKFKADPGSKFWLKRTAILLSEHIC